MESTLAIEASHPSGAASPSAAAASADAPGISFHELLSELNPLQYVPVVGNIYRAVTGDNIPEPVHMAGCAIFSGLTGGPIGVAIYAAITAAEKLTGIDPDRIAHAVLASVGLADDAPATAVAGASGAVPSGVVIAAYTRTQQMELLTGGHA